MENPILTYYSPLSRFARRKVAFRLFILANVVLVALVTYWLGTDKSASRQAIFLQCSILLGGLLTFMPSIAFLLFTPRDRSRARQEELLAAGMTPWEILIGYCYPPLSVSVLLTGIYTLWLGATAFLLASRHLYDMFEIDGLLLVALLDLAGLGIISTSAALRNWIRDPESTVRALAWVPLVTVGMMAFSYLLRFGLILPFEAIRLPDQLRYMAGMTILLLASPLTVGVWDARYTHRSLLERTSPVAGVETPPVPIGAL